MQRAPLTRSTKPLARDLAAPRGGFTLAESLIASVVLAVAVIGVAATLSASHQNSAALETEAQAASLARQLIEEIAAKPLVLSDATAGWPADKDRRNYDSVNDYAGYEDESPFTMLDGQEIGAAGAFKRIVTLTSPNSLFGTTPPAGDFVIVKVAVQDGNGGGCVLHRLVSRTTLTR